MAVKECRLIDFLVATEQMWTAAKALIGPLCIDILLVPVNTGFSRVID